MTKALLDASALLALIQDEAGADVVEQALSNASIHSVNLAEVTAKLSDRQMPEEQVRALIDEIAIEVIEGMEADLAIDIGVLMSKGRRFGLSLGDCVCLAVARRNGQDALTTDRVWSELPFEGLRVKVIR